MELAKEGDHEMDMILAFGGINAFQVRISGS